jgi:hypothetical protein
MDIEHPPHKQSKDKKKKAKKVVQVGTFDE